MKDWNFKRSVRVSEESIYSNNLGQAILKPKYIKSFVNISTGQYVEISDVDSKKYKRNRLLNLFNQRYLKSYKLKRISILSAVVLENKYESISKFLNSFSKKLHRKGVSILGYVWTRDVGEVKFENHFHILLATSRINEELFQELFQSKKHSNYEIEFVKNPQGIKKYLTIKELYWSHRKRSFGKSRKFLEPKQLPTILKCFTNKSKNTQTV